MLSFFSPAGKAPAPKRTCRYLTVRGLPCQQNPLIGQDFCYQHGKHRHPVCPSGPTATIPLIENSETVQLITSQVAQGLFAQTLDPIRAGKILYACQVAAMTFPRPARLQPVQAQPVEPVTEVFESPDGELLGPAECTPASRARFDAAWSFDKFRYEQECERLGQPLPQTPADMPAAGWLNPDDLERITEQANSGKFLLNDGYRDKMLDLRLDADRRGALPPLAERECAYGDESWCRGPGARGPWQSACARCTRERDEYRRLHPDEPVPPGGSGTADLQAAAAAPPHSRRAQRLHRTQAVQRRGGACTPVVEAVNIAKLCPCNTKSCRAVTGGAPPRQLTPNHQCEIGRKWARPAKYSAS